MLYPLIHILIGLFTLILALRMFVSARDAHFNPLFSGIHRATDPVMIPIHQAIRRKPVDAASADFLVLIPIILLVVLDGVLMGILIPKVSIFRGITYSIQSFFDTAFLIYVILILIYSIFFKYARFSSNPFVRTGFKIMEPVYVFIGKYLPPLKNRPGITAFVIGFAVYFIIAVIMFSLVTIGEPYIAEHPGTLLTLAMRHSLSTLLWLATFFTWVIIIGALMSWISPDPRNPVVEIIRLLSEPINRPFRKYIPTIGGIDISPIFSIMALQLVAQTGAQLINNIFSAMPQ